MKNFTLLLGIIIFNLSNAQINTPPKLSDGGGWNLDVKTKLSLNIVHKLPKNEIFYIWTTKGVDSNDYSNLGVYFIVNDSILVNESSQRKLKIYRNGGAVIEGRNIILNIEEGDSSSKENGLNGYFKKVKDSVLNSGIAGKWYLSGKLNEKPKAPDVLICDLTKSRYVNLTFEKLYDNRQGLEKKYYFQVIIDGVSTVMGISMGDTIRLFGKQIILGLLIKPQEADNQYYYFAEGVFHIEN